jgi:hypothetical protein
MYMFVCVCGGGGVYAQFTKIISIYLSIYLSIYIYVFGYACDQAWQMGVNLSAGELCVSITG